MGLVYFLKPHEWLPSRKLTYPTWGKGKSSSNMPYQGDMLIPWRVIMVFMVAKYAVRPLDPKQTPSHES